MEKPITIASGSITGANLSGSLLFRFDIGPQLLSNPIWANKVSGFLHVRGTAVVRLQINANPFQCGRLILCYIPQYASDTRRFTMHLTNLMTITQLPHVEMTMQDTECELEIPYIAPTTHYNLRTGNYDWGTVFCYIYSPLAIGSGGTNQVTYNTWMSFNDFELEVPVVPQMAGGMPSGKKHILKKYRVNAIKSNIDSEVNEGKGPISSILSNVSSIASTLYSVPMLAPIAGPTAWFSNMMSGVASAFGWSKPMIDSQVCRMVSNPHPYLGNTNTADVSTNLALIADNRVNVMPDVNLSGVDEMALAFIKKQKAYFGEVSWTSTSLPGPLFNYTILPSNFSTNIASIPFGATNDVYPTTYTPVGFLGSLYQYWRGSIEITMKIVKTQYHTGRLVVAFNPQLSFGSVSTSNTNYLHREIIDLRDGDEFCITVPYCYTSMYMNTDGNFNDMRMLFSVNVLNELVAPDTVTQSVQILFEVRGGDDLEFQVPKGVPGIPIQCIAPQGAGDDQVTPILCNTIGNSTVHDPLTQASGLCIGEHSTSVLQLCKRYTKLASNFVFTGQNSFRVYPFTWGGLYVSGVPTGGNNGPLCNDYLSLFAGCYAHSRGGVRYRMVADPVSEADLTAGSMISTLVPHNVFLNSFLTLGSATVWEGLGLDPLEQPTGYTSPNGATGFDTAYVAGTAVTVPMYSRTFTRINRMQFSAGALSSTEVSRPDWAPYALKIVSTSTAFGAATSVYRCGSDDFQLSFWLGVPPLAILLP